MRSLACIAAIVLLAGQVRPNEAFFGDWGDEAETGGDTANFGSEGGCGSEGGGDAWGSEGGGDTWGSEGDGDTWGGEAGGDAWGSEGGDEAGNFGDPNFFGDTTD